MPTIEARVKEVVSNNLCVKQEELKDDAKFAEDLGADSLDLIELSMAIEEEFQGEMTDEEARELLTVGQLVKYVEKKVAEAAANHTNEWRR